MDVIDIGLKVFDRLVDKYGEDPESRLLFLAGCMTGYKWFVINSDKTILVSDGGISANWEDELFTQINADLRADLRGAGSRARWRRNGRHPRHGLAAALRHR